MAEEGPKLTKDEQKAPPGGDLCQCEACRQRRYADAKATVDRIMKQVEAEKHAPKLQDITPKTRAEMNPPDKDMPHMDTAYLKIRWQDGPVREVGMNGTQATSVLRAVKRYLKHVSAGKPDKWTGTAIEAVGIALYALRSRTRAREKAGVEGTSTREPMGFAKYVAPGFRALFWSPDTVAVNFNGQVAMSTKRYPEPVRLPGWLSFDEVFAKGVKS